MIRQSEEIHMRGVVSIADQPQTANMALWARSILLADGDGSLLQDLVKDLPTAVQKAVNAPMLSTDNDMLGLVHTQSVLTSFAPLLKNSSAFYYLWANRMMPRAPMRQRFSFLTGNAAVTRVGEGQQIAVSRQSSDQVFLDPVKAAGIMVISKEMKKFLSEQAAEHFLSTELARAVSTATDAGMFEEIEDGSTPTQGSAGPTPVDAIQDLKWLLDSVGLKAESKPLWVAAPDVAVGAATLYGNGGLVFPQMGPTGGVMLNTPCLVTDALDPGTLGLIDGAGLAGDVEGVTITLAKHATLQLNDAPDSPPTAATTMVNLFQAGLVALMPEAYFAVARMRNTAFAKITNINWGGAISG
jgi:hypothetical protein